MPRPQSFHIGNIGEEFAKSVLSKADIQVEKNENTETRLDFDLVCVFGKHKFTCEVKYDVMAQRTGNIAIEHYNTKQDKPSGIMATKADIWLHIIKDGTNLTCWACSVDDLKQFIKDHTPYREIASGGDDNAALYLYREDDILNVLFKRLEILDKGGLIKTIKSMLGK